MFLKTQSNATRKYSKLHTSESFFQNLNWMEITGNIKGIRWDVRRKLELFWNRFKLADVHGEIYIEKIIFLSLSLSHVFILYIWPIFYACNPMYYLLYLIAPHFILTALYGSRKGCLWRISIHPRVTRPKL